LCSFRRSIAAFDLPRFVLLNFLAWKSFEVLFLDSFLLLVLECFGFRLLLDFFAYAGGAVLLMPVVPVSPNVLSAPALLKPEAI
jgi:hypothetical protein